MIRNLTNSLNNVLYGPINKPLVADNHDIMGNSLGPTVQLFRVDNFVATNFGPTTFWVNSTSPYTTNNSFTVSGEDYTVTDMSVLYISAGTEGNHTFVLLTCSTGSGGTSIDTAVVGQDIGETMGIRFLGSGGTQDYYPLVLGSGSEYEWKSNTVNNISLKLATGGVFPPWSDGSTPFGSGMNNGDSDDLTVSLLT